MIINVSVNQFRQQISDYITKVKNGYTIILKDGTKDQQIAQIVGKKKFDPEAFGNALKDTAGVFTTKNHPEWQTKEDVIKWVKKGRRAADRNF